MPARRFIRGVYLVAPSQDELGNAAGEDMGRCLQEAMVDAPSGVKTVLVDMKDVGYLRSSGLGAILAFSQLMQQRGVKVAVCAAPPFGRNLFLISGLDQILPVFRDLASALEALASKGDVGR